MTLQGTAVVAFKDLSYATDCAAVSVSFDSAGAPAAVVLALPNLDVHQINAVLDYPTARKCLVGLQLSVSLNGGGHASFAVKGLAGIVPGDDGSVTVKGLTDQVVISPKKPLEGPGGSWLLRLVNVSFRHGDFTRRIVGKNTVRFLHDTIRFTAQGRDWDLIDHRQMLEPAARDKLDQSFEAVVTSTLQTPWQEGDKVETVGGIAEGITALLSIAMSRRVCWLEIVRVDAAGQQREGLARATWTAGASEGGIAVIDQRDTGEIRAFVESAYPKYIERPDWWQETIGIFLHAQIVTVLNAKAILLNVLLEKLATLVVGTKFPCQIAENLDQIVDGQTFIDALQATFASFIKGWPIERTQKVIGTIKGWNAGPDLPVKVQQACKALDLEEPAKKLIKPRNPILHQGIMRVDYKNLGDYWTDLDALILLMILRLLGYDGVFYHHKFGPNPIPLRKLMKDADVGPQGEKANKAPGN
jgi:hypothetical protein